MCCGSVIKGGIIGGIIAFIWVMISWTIIPWHCGTINNFKSDTYVATAIKENATTSGIYVMPNMHNKDGMTKPMVFAAVDLDGFGSLPVHIIASLITQIVAAGFISFLVCKSKMMHYWCRVWFVVLVAIIAWILCMVPCWNWWNFPAGYVFVALADLVIAWFLAGLAIAGFAKPKGTCCKTECKTEEPSA